MKKQNGITLVEVLATLTIVMIISSVIYSVFFGVGKNYNRISHKTNLQQEANLMISTIRNYQLGTDPYTIKYDSTSKQLSLKKGTTSIELGKSDLKIEPVTVIYNNVTNTSTSSSKNNFDISISDTSKSLKLTFTITDSKDNQTYNVDTIIKRY